jgi:hypothetical protein
VKGLVRTDLDEARCSNPDCDEDHGPLYLHSQCHPASPTWAFYEDGQLVIECAECRTPVTVVQVATA